MNRVRQPASVVALLCLLLVLSVVACNRGGQSAQDARPEPGDDPQAAAPPGGEGGSEVEPLRSHGVEVYFPSALDHGLVGEFREIFDTLHPGDRAKQIIADLIGGPTVPDALRALPPGTRLRQIYVLEDGTAYLDFSGELTEGMAGGSMEELLTVYAIVDSVVINVAEIRRVGILVNGKTLETLSGHVDLRRPLGPDYTLILGSIIVDGDDSRPTAERDQGFVARLGAPTDDEAGR